MNVASPSCLARSGAPASPSDLPRYDLVGLGHETWRFLDGRREIIVRPHGRFTADSGEALLAAVITGLGIGMLPAFLAASSLKTGKVVQILPAFPSPETSLSLLRPPPNTHPPAQVAVMSEMSLTLETAVVGRDLRSTDTGRIRRLGGGGRGARPIHVD